MTQHFVVNYFSSYFDVVKVCMVAFCEQINNFLLVFLRAAEKSLSIYLDFDSPTKPLVLLFLFPFLLFSARYPQKSKFVGRLRHFIIPLSLLTINYAS